MLFILGFAELLREPIERLLVWIDEHWVPGTLLLVLATLLVQWRRIRRARAVRVGDPGARI